MAGSKERNFLKYCLVFCLVAAGFLSCRESIEPFRGFVPTEVEQLLADTLSKDWLRVAVSTNGQNQELRDCSDSIIYTFHRPVDSLGTNNLLFVTFPSECDSTAICQSNPIICERRDSACADFPLACDTIAAVNESTFWVGYWEPTEPFFENAPTDSVKTWYGQDTTFIFIENITSLFLDWRFNEQGSEGGQQVVESFQSNF